MPKRRKQSISYYMEMNCKGALWVSNLIQVEGPLEWMFAVAKMINRSVLYEAHPKVVSKCD